MPANEEIVAPLPTTSPAAHVLRSQNIIQDVASRLASTVSLETVRQEQRAEQLAEVSRIFQQLRQQKEEKTTPARAVSELREPAGLEQLTGQGNSIQGELATTPPETPALTPAPASIEQQRPFEDANALFARFHQELEEELSQLAEHANSARFTASVMKAQVGALRQLTSSEQDTTRPGTASSLFAAGPLFSSTGQVPETASQRLAHVVSHPVLFADDDADMAAQDLAPRKLDMNWTDAPDGDQQETTTQSCLFGETNSVQNEAAEDANRQKAKHDAERLARFQELFGSPGPSSPRSQTQDHPISRQHSQPLLFFNISNGNNVSHDAERGLFAGLRRSSSGPSTPRHDQDDEPRRASNVAEPSQGEGIDFNEYHGDRQDANTSPPGKLFHTREPELRIDDPMPLASVSPASNSQQTGLSTLRTQYASARAQLECIVLEHGALTGELEALRDATQTESMGLASLQAARAAEEARLVQVMTMLEQARGALLQRERLLHEQSKAITQIPPPAPVQTHDDMQVRRQRVHRRAKRQAIRRSVSCGELAALVNASMPVDRGLTKPAVSVQQATSSGKGVGQALHDQASTTAYPVPSASQLAMLKPALCDASTQSDSATAFPTDGIGSASLPDHVKPMIQTLQELLQRTQGQAEQAARQLEQERVQHAACQADLLAAKQQLRSLRVHGGAAVLPDTTSNNKVVLSTAKEWWGQHGAWAPPVSAKPLSMVGWEDLVEEAAADLDRLETAVASTAQRLSDCQTQLAAAASQLADHEQRKVTAQQEMAVAQLQLVDLQASCQEFEKQQAVQTAAKVDLETQVKNCQCDLDRYKAELQAMQQKLAETGLQLAEKHDEAAEYQQQSKQARDEMLLVEGNSKEAMEKLEFIKTATTSAIVDRDSAEQELSQVRQELRERNMELQSVVSKLSDVQAQYAHEAELLESARKQLEAATNNHSQLNNEVQALSSQLQELKQRHETLQAAIASTVSKHMEVKSQLDQAKSALATAEQQVASYKQEANAWMSKAKESQAAAESSAEASAKADTKLQESEQRLTAVKERIKQAEQRLLDLQQQQSRLQMQTHSKAAGTELQGQQCSGTQQRKIWWHIDNTEMQGLLDADDHDGVMPTPAPSMSLARRPKAQGDASYQNSKASTSAVRNGNEQQHAGQPQDKDTYAAAMSALHDEVAGLQAGLAAAHSRRRMAEAQVAELQEQLQQLQAAARNASTVKEQGPASALHHLTQQLAQHQSSSELLTRVAELDNEVVVARRLASQYKNQCTAAQQEAMELQDTVHSQQVQIARLRQQLADARAQAALMSDRGLNADHLSSILSSHKHARTSQWESDMDLAEQMLQKLKLQERELRASVARLTEEQSSLEHKCGILRQQLDDAASDQAAARQALAAAKMALQKVVLQEEQGHTRIMQVQDELAELMKEKSSEQQQLRHVRNQCIQVEAAVQELQAMQLDLQRQVALLEKQAAALSNASARIKPGDTNEHLLRSERSDRPESQGNKTDEVVELVRELENVQAELDICQAQLLSAEEERQGVKSALDACRSELHTTQAQLTAAKSQLTARNSEISELQAELAESRHELAEQIQKVADSAEQLANVKKQLKDSKSRVQELESQLFDQAKELEGLKKELDIKSKLVEEQGNSLFRTQQKLQATAQQLNAKDLELKAMQQQLESALGHAESLCEQLLDADKKHDDLQAQEQKIRSERDDLEKSLNEHITAQAVSLRQLQQAQEDIATLQLECLLLRQQLEEQQVEQFQQQINTFTNNTKAIQWREHPQANQHVAEDSDQQKDRDPLAVVLFPDVPEVVNRAVSSAPVSRDNANLHDGSPLQPSFPSHVAIDVACQTGQVASDENSAEPDSISKDITDDQLQADSERLVLMEQIHEQQQQLSELQAQLSALAETVQQANAAAEATHLQAAAAEEALNAHQLQAAQEHAKVVSQAAQIEKMQQELGNLRGKLVDAQSSRRADKMNAVGIEQQLAQARANEAAALTSLEKESARVAKLQHELDATAGLQLGLSAALEETAELRSRVATLMQSLETLEAWKRKQLMQAAYSAQLDSDGSYQQLQQHLAAALQDTDDARRALQSAEEMLHSEQKRVLELEALLDEAQSLLSDQDCIERKQMAALESQLQDANKELATLRPLQQQIEHLHNQLHNAEQLQLELQPVQSDLARLDSLEGELHEAKQQLVACQEQIRHLKAEAARIDPLELQNQQLRANTSLLELELHAVVDQKETLQRQLMECEHDLQEARQSIGVLEKQVQTANAKANAAESLDETRKSHNLGQQASSEVADMLRMKISEQEEQIAALQVDLQSARDEVEKIQAAAAQQQASYESQLQCTEEQAKELADAKQEVLKELEDAQTSIVQLEEAIAQHKQEALQNASKLQAASLELESRLHDTETRCSQLQQEVAELKAALQEARQHEQDMQAALACAEERLGKAQNMFSEEQLTWQQQVVTLQQTIQELRKAPATIGDVQLSQKQCQEHATQTELVQVPPCLDSDQISAEQRSHKISQQERALAELEARAKSVRCAVESDEDKAAQLQSDIAAAERNLQDKQQQLVAMAQELQKLQTSVQAADARVAEACADFEELQQHSAHLRKTLKEEVQNLACAVREAAEHWAQHRDVMYNECVVLQDQHASLVTDIMEAKQVLQDDMHGLRAAAAVKTATAGMMAVSKRLAELPQASSSYTAVQLTEATSACQQAVDQALTAQASLQVLAAHQAAAASALQQQHHQQLAEFDDQSEQRLSQYVSGDVLCTPAYSDAVETPTGSPAGMTRKAQQPSRHDNCHASKAKLGNVATAEHGTQTEVARVSGFVIPDESLKQGKPLNALQGQANHNGEMTALTQLHQLICSCTELQTLAIAQQQRLKESASAVVKTYQHAKKLYMYSQARTQLLQVELERIVAGCTADASKQGGSSATARGNTSKQVAGNGPIAGMQNQQLLDKNSTQAASTALLKSQEAWSSINLQLLRMLKHAAHAVKQTGSSHIDDNAVQLPDATQEGDAGGTQGGVGMLQADDCGCQCGIDLPVKIADIVHMARGLQDVLVQGSRHEQLNGAFVPSVHDRTGVDDRQHHQTWAACHTNNNSNNDSGSGSRQIYGSKPVVDDGGKDAQGLGNGTGYDSRQQLEKAQYENAVSAAELDEALSRLGLLQPSASHGIANAHANVSDAATPRSPPRPTSQPVLQIHLTVSSPVHRSPSKPQAILLLGAGPDNASQSAANLLHGTENPNLPQHVNQAGQQYGDVHHSTASPQRSTYDIMITPTQTPVKRQGGVNNAIVYNPSTPSTSNGNHLLQRVRLMRQHLKESAMRSSNNDSSPQI